MRPGSGAVRPGLSRSVLAGAVLVLALAAPRAGRTGGVLDTPANSTTLGNFLFPNWTMAHVGDFSVISCADATCGCGSMDIVGLTILNYGTAQAGTDIQDVYFEINCAKAATGTLAMTYAGIYDSVGGAKPAWTWSGAFNIGKCDACVCNLDVYVDISPCPTEDRTVQMGIGVNDVLNPISWSGGLYDNCGYAAPWGYTSVDPSLRTIRYAVKLGDKNIVAPADTVTYTVYYGRPGTAALSNIVVMDSLPQYTHYVAGSAAPAPDPGWNPDTGPPFRLKWTRPGGATTGGPTDEVTFKITVDWGNCGGLCIEPQSGAVAAPEGTRLKNRAEAFFYGTDCPQISSVTPPVDTAVRRFLMWKLGDNDVLFSGSPGQPPDEMIYSIYLKNVSDTKTWWDVSIWDTVPAELDSWCVNCGFNDPCVGWTMTPSGCSAASPDKVVTGSKSTVLHWRLDMPPGATLEVKWKAQVKSTATANSAALGIASVLEYGKTDIIGGTGHSTDPKTFAHLARIILPTTYVSYIMYGAGNAADVFFLGFFPLNKKTQFELRSLEYVSDAYAAAGGKSDSIGCFIGDCLGGFPGNPGPCPAGGIPGGGIAGCKAERTPAQYYHPDPGSSPFNILYKTVSNSPLNWQMLGDRDSHCADHMTFAPSTTMSFTGLMHYWWRRTQTDNQKPSYGDIIMPINTGKDPYGVYDPNLATTVHMFQFDYGTLQWKYRRTYELDKESTAWDNMSLTADEGPWRSISSNAQLIVNQTYDFHPPGYGCCCGCCGHNLAHYWPTRETGNVISKAGTGTFYGPVHGNMGAGPPNVVIGNSGAVDATYNIYRYVPTLATAPPAGTPNDLKGTAGIWIQVSGDSVPAGLNSAANPKIYSLQGGQFNNGSIALFKVELTSGGPIQVIGGINAWAVWGGGGVLHPSDPVNNPLGNQTGTEFWIHHTYRDDTGGGSCEPSTYAVDIFCPKTGMVVQGISETAFGYSATYTTDGPDQCIAFMGLRQENVGEKTNYRFNVLPGPNSGNVIAAFVQCWAEKGYTAPFMVTGTHYAIIAPPVAFVGQKFWMTIVVVDETNTTKTDYCATNGFTSTDPLATMTDPDVTNPGPLGGVTAEWSSSSACSDGSDDDGVKLFVEVTFNTLGFQTIIATDLNDGSITGLTAIMVVGADVKLFKEPKLAIAASGDTVQFKVCWSNYSSASAFALVINDAVPDGTTYVPEAATSHDCGNTGGVPLTLSYAVTSSPFTPPASDYVTIGGASQPSAGTTWLRWTVPQAGVNTTGCACFKVRVN